MYGPSGSGKTFIAQSIAKELRINSLSIKGPELLNKYIGASEQAVRDAFEKAEKKRPCLLIFDEFDAVVPKRTAGAVSVTDRVVNQFLCYLDGVEEVKGVFVLAISTRPDLIDPAIVRAGRIDQHVYCPLPDFNDRKLFFNNRLALLNCSDECKEDGQINQLADMTKGFSFANLAGYMRNLQIVFFERLNEYDEKKAAGSQVDEKDLKLNTQDLLGLVEKSEAFGNTNEYKKLVKIYSEFSKKGLVADRNKYQKQILM